MIRDVLVALLGLVTFSALSGGCCWLSKRSCFPTCPPPDRVVVTTERPCQLPPVTVDTVTSEQCPEGYEGTCLSVAESGKLAKNLSTLKTWIKNARIRCASILKPASQPTSNPTAPVP